jgi:alpha-tubulin suppressor-like RCC1 family protein
VLGDRSVRCWGGNRTSVSILADAVALATNEYGTCVVDTGGSVDCWGAYPQLGTGTTTGSSAPTPMQGLGGVASLAIGTWDYCAVRQDGSLRCWAYDAYSSLGTMSTAGDVPGITSALGVAVGDSSACVRLAGGEVRCWGQNSSGQLGSGTSVFTNLPVTVTGF